MDAKRGRYRLIRPHLWLAVITVAATAPGLFVSVIDGRYRTGGARLTPEVMWIVDATGIGLLGFALAAIAVLIWKGRARMAGRSARFKVVYGAAAILGQVAVVFGLALALIVANFNLFDGHYLGVKARSPAGDRTAYLYSGGLFCGYQVFVRQDGASRLTPFDSFTTDCDDRPANPELHWSTDSRSIQVTGPGGAPIPHKTIHILPPAH